MMFSENSTVLDDEWPDEHAVASTVCSPVTDLTSGIKGLHATGSGKRQLSMNTSLDSFRRRLSLNASSETSPTSLTSSSCCDMGARCTCHSTITELQPERRITQQISMDDGFVDMPEDDWLDSPFIQQSCSSTVALQASSGSSAFRRLLSMPVRPLMSDFEPTPPSKNVQYSQLADGNQVVSSSSDRSLSSHRSALSDRTNLVVGNNKARVPFVSARRRSSEPVVMVTGCSSQLFHEYAESVSYERQLTADSSYACGTIESEEDHEFLGDYAKSPAPDSTQTGLAMSSLIPRKLSGLFFAPLIESNDEDLEPASSSSPSKTESVNVGRALFRSPSVPAASNMSGTFRSSRSGAECLIRRGSLKKRSDSTYIATTKRLKSAVDSCNEEVESLMMMDSKTKSTSGGRKVPFVRCHSESELMIMTALNYTDTHSDLIGDFSRSHCLPLVSNNKHPDLRTISAETLARLLAREYVDVVNNFVIVDCRYPYEFNGGHIQGARNVFTQESIFSEFLSSPPVCGRRSSPHAMAPDVQQQKRDVLIFHCEFSSERGPNLMKYLRRKDRDMNSYPQLHYPEMYLLSGGFKEFYETHSEFCLPNGYVPMLHADHASDLKFYRNKSVSWNSDSKHRSGHHRVLLKL